MRRELAAWCLALAACTAEVRVEPSKQKLTRVFGAPLPATEVASSTISLNASPQRLSTLAGRVAVGTDDGVLLGSAAQDDKVAIVPVVASRGEPALTGQVRALVRRAGGGLLVAGSEGLFHDQSERLVPSPLSAALPKGGLRSLDAIGEGSAEELWAIADGGLYHVAQGQLALLDVSSLGQMVQAAVATGERSVLLVVDGTAYHLVLETLVAELLAKDLRAPLGVARSDDRTVYLATGQGLFSRTRQGTLTMRVFADEGALAPPVRAVSAAEGALLVAVDDQVVSVDEQSSTVLLARPKASLTALTVDAFGDAWAGGSAQLFRLRTGAPVSFTKDVQPFLQAHCTSCHRAGTSGAPVIALDSLEVARQYAKATLRRLNADGASPMPPASVETLTARDYAVVTRWVSGGMLP